MTVKNDNQSIQFWDLTGSALKQTDRKNLIISTLTNLTLLKDKYITDPNRHLAAATIYERYKNASPLKKKSLIFQSKKIKQKYEKIASEVFRLDLLPDELKFLIFKRLDEKNLLAMALVSRQFHYLVQDYFEFYPCKIKQLGWVNKVNRLANTLEPDIRPKDLDNIQIAVQFDSPNPECATKINWIISRGTPFPGDYIFKTSYFIDISLKDMSGFRYMKILKTRIFFSLNESYCSEEVQTRVRKKFLDFINENYKKIYENP